jgi:isopenicillin N synthase-like dioxygenase
LSLQKCVDATKESVGQQLMAEKLLEAFTTIGFATLINHGIDNAVIDQAFNASKAFFVLPMETKLQYKFQGYESNRGYIPFGLETHDKKRNTNSKTPDLKETFDIGTEEKDDVYANRWPAELDDELFRKPLMKYFSCMDGLHLRLLRLLGIALKLEDPSYFVDRCNQQHQNLRLLHYPSLNVNEHLTQQHEPNANVGHREPIIRGDVHTDFGTITLLCQDAVGGLRVQRLDGSWTMVPPVPHSVVVNVGDMLQRWTNDILRANPHQVIEVVPSVADNDSTSTPTDENIVPERWSIAFFCNANKTIMLECLPECVTADFPAQYAPMNAHDYLTMRLSKTISTSAIKN